jgi:hypothetical protein
MEAIAILILWFGSLIALATAALTYGVDSRETLADDHRQ